MASSNFTQLTLEPLIACIQDRIQHGLMQQVEAHPLADYDVNLVRELHVLNSLVYHLDDVTQPIMRDQNGRMAGDAARFHCKHSLALFPREKLWIIQAAIVAKITTVTSACRIITCPIPG